MAPNEQAQQSELKCKYCGKQYKSAKWLEAHEVTCAKNPSVAQEKPQTKTKSASKSTSKSAKKPLQSNVVQNNVNNYEWVLCEDGYYYSQQGNILYCYDPYTNQYFSQYYDPRVERRRRVFTTLGSIIGALIVIGVIILYCFVGDYSSDYSGSESSYTPPVASYEPEVCYPWIVGRWRVSTPYGIEIIQFEGDGSGGDFTASSSGQSGSPTFEWGTYKVYEDRIRLKFDGESIGTIIEIHGTGSLHHGGGYYYTKIR